MAVWRATQNYCEKAARLAGALVDQMVAKKVAQMVEQMVAQRADQREDRLALHQVVLLAGPQVDHSVDRMVGMVSLRDVRQKTHQTVFQWVLRKTGVMVLLSVRKNGTECLKLGWPDGCHVGIPVGMHTWRVPGQKSVIVSSKHEA